MYVYVQVNVYTHKYVYDVMQCMYVLVPFPQDEEVEIAIQKCHGRLAGQRRECWKKEEDFFFIL